MQAAEAAVFNGADPSGSCDRNPEGCVGFDGGPCGDHEAGCVPYEEADPLWRCDAQGRCAEELPAGCYAPPCRLPGGGYESPAGGPDGCLMYCAPSDPYADGGGWDADGAMDDYWDSRDGGDPYGGGGSGCDDYFGCP